MSSKSFIKRSFKMVTCKYLISPEKDLIAAIKLLNEVTPKLLLVVKDLVVLGSISDGDIRRALLSGAELSILCTEVMKKNFKSINLVDYKNSERTYLSIKFRDFKICVELPIKAHKSKLKYTSTPSFERKRIAGKKKVKPFLDGLHILIGMCYLFFNKVL